MAQKRTFAQSLAVLGVALVLAAGSINAQTVAWRIGRWNPDSFGNQRVVLHLDATPDASARAIVAWRRSDAVEQRRWIVTDSDNRRVANAMALHLDRDSLDLVFQPIAGAGTYYLYYLPYTGSVRSNYPRITYPKPDSLWAGEWAATARRSADSLPRARVVAFEAVDSMSQRWPMEIVASAREQSLRDTLRAGASIAAFVVPRELPIRMRHDIPQLLATSHGRVVLGPASQDEYYVFQIGVWSERGADSITVAFADAAGRTTRVAANAFDCINLDGVDWLGRPFTLRVDVPARSMQALWCGVMVPRTGHRDTLHVNATVGARGEKPVSVPFDIAVGTDTVVNHGDDEPARLSRLRWLDSRLAQDGQPTPPYTAVQRVPGGFAVLGRRILLANNGLPSQVLSTFTHDVTLGASFHPLLAAPFAFDIGGAPTAWTGGAVHVTSANSSRVVFTSRSHAGALDLAVTGTLDFDGNLEYQAALVARRDTAVSDVRLTLPMRTAQARLFMGMNLVGAAAPVTYHWTWDQRRNQDAFWLGDVDGGMQLTFKDEHYVRPLNTNFYQQSPLRMPRSWMNGGKGSCDFAATPTVYRASCGSGRRTLAAGDTLWFNFRVLVTPFHPIDTRTHFATRYYHAYQPVDTVRAVGANLVNVHHATAINPYLNYPFLRAAAMKAYADSLHAAGMRLKIYYTVRELTNRAPEFWALRSLGTEIFSDGPGGGHSWLQEHVVDHYITGWVVPDLRDVTLVTNGISRWHNFYVEGMQWLTQHAGVDGIYLDDVAFDRATMLRIRRVLASNGTPGEKIDLHSATQYNPNDGFASSANLYLEHFPFIDRLWFGEGFNYDSPPDYYLVEMSGIPFGLMGEMLEGGGNAWRGMLFGMTNRLPWTGSDPRSLWKAWDAFGITTATMHGWWNPAAPVHTGRNDVLATTYTRRGRALVALASWARDTVPITLKVDWRALGLDPRRTRITAPAIEGFQPAREFRAGESIPVAPRSGWFLRLDPLGASPRAR